MHQNVSLPRVITPSAIRPAPSVLSMRNLAIAIVAVAILALPFFVKNFIVFQITMAIIYAIAILGLNLLTGINGQFSLG
ncbi:MAG: branched-chain amino acid transport system permease protein, partial [Variibacter sp.]|nr:branched-chain amino acid transport system permease protein [Variibacter sp.]